MTPMTYRHPARDSLAVPSKHFRTIVQAAIREGVRLTTDAIGFSPGDSSLY